MTVESTVIQRLRTIRGVSYGWRPGAEDRARWPGAGGRELGVLAQDVEAAFPEAVVIDSDGLKRVDYSGLVAVLIEAVKELDRRLEALEPEQRL